MATFEPLMAQYTDDCEMEILPELPDNKQRIILVTYDESHFYANDGCRQY